MTLQYEAILFPLLSPVLAVEVWSYKEFHTYSHDSQSYDYEVTHDANGHITAQFPDALGRDRYVQSYSIPGSVGANITAKGESQYNVLDKATAEIVTDMAPQAGQSITSVTTTATYDDLGRLVAARVVPTGARIPMILPPKSHRRRPYRMSSSTMTMI